MGKALSFIYKPSINYKRKAVWKVCIKNKKSLQVDKNYKIAIIKHICQQLCKSFVQVPMTVGMEPSDLGVGCLGWLMLVDSRVCYALLGICYGILTGNGRNRNPHATKCSTQSQACYQLSGRLEGWGFPNQVTFSRLFQLV